MNNPKFTKRHYEEIYKHTKKLIDELSVDLDYSKNKWNKEDIRNLDTLDGIIYAHNMLGKLFYEDNPNFNPEKWNIKGVLKTIRGE